MNFIKQWFRSTKKSKQNTQLLGSRLVRAGVIQREQLETALQQQKGNSELLGQILIRLSYIDEDGLKPFLNGNQSQRSLIHIDLDQLNSPEFTEIYRLQSQIKFALFSDVPLKTIMLTSPLPREGKTLCSAYMAVITAVTLEKKVLLIDADLRNPSVHKAFHLPNVYGLTDVLIDSWPVEKSVRTTKLPNLHVLTAGTRATNPSHLLSSAIMERLLEHFSKEYDLIFLDSSPILLTADASLLGATVNGTILVADASVSRIKELEKAVGKLRQANANVMGVLLNRYSGGDLKRYKSGYEYYYRGSNNNHS